MPNVMDGSAANSGKAALQVLRTGRAMEPMMKIYAALKEGESATTATLSDKSRGAD